MAKRLPVLGSRGVYLSSRPEGWFVCNPAGETALGRIVLTEDYLAALFGCASVRILSDAVLLTH